MNKDLYKKIKEKLNSLESELEDLKEEDKESKLKVAVSSSLGKKLHETKDEEDDELNKEDESNPYSELEPVFYNTIYGNEGAVNSAKDYLKFMAASKTKIISFLKKQGFTEEEAIYGAENCGADWYDQALRMAMSYLNVQEFTYEQLALQLMIEGFTEDEIIYVLTVIYEASMQ